MQISRQLSIGQTFIQIPDELAEIQTDTYPQMCKSRHSHCMQFESTSKIFVFTEQRIDFSFSLWNQS